MSSTESDEQRQSRLARRREAYRRRRDSETGEQREQRLQRRRQQRANETPEQRETRLSRNKSSTQQQRANETPEQRETRMSRNRSSTQQQRANETPEQREARLNARRTSSTRLLHSDSDHVLKFHTHMTDLVTRQSTCHTCHEMMYDTQSVLCNRCHRDTSAVPCFSDVNNMNPGEVPHQLQVYIVSHFVISIMYYI